MLDCTASLSGTGDSAMLRNREHASLFRPPDRLLSSRKLLIFTKIIWQSGSAAHSCRVSANRRALGEARGAATSSAWHCKGEKRPSPPAPSPKAGRGGGRSPEDLVNRGSAAASSAYGRAMVFVGAAPSHTFSVNHRVGRDRQNVMTNSAYGLPGSFAKFHRASWKTAANSQTDLTSQSR